MCRLEEVLYVNNHNQSVEQVEYDSHFEQPESVNQALIGFVRERCKNIRIICVISTRFHKLLNFATR